MASSPDVLDCKIQLRSYILKKCSSPFGKPKENRTVVRSPVLEVSDTISRLPVKRYTKARMNNSVRFIPTTDIEPDSSNAYRKFGVDKEPLWENAHGVAMYDSSADQQSIACRRGDLFWISVLPFNVGYKADAAVVNLRTLETGVIPLGMVCWFPCMQGPNLVLWTLGGDIRFVRRAAAKQFDEYSWVVSQPQDGSEPFGEHDICIRSPVINLGDRRFLPLEEAQALYEQRFRCMVGSGVSRARSMSPARPPSSPDSEFGVKSRLKISRPSHSFSRPMPLTGDGGMLNGKRLAVPIPESGSRTSQTSTVDMPESRISKRQKTFSPAGVDVAHEEKAQPSPLPQKSAIFSASLLEDSICPTQSEAPSSMTECSILNDPTIISVAYSKNQRERNLKLIELCDLKDPECRFTILSKTAHFHSPANKCQLTESHICGTSRIPHEHCISRLRPFPSGAGECLLVSRPSRRHVCCSWKPSDLSGFPTLFSRHYVNPKSRDEKTRKVSIHSSSAYVDQFGGAGAIGLGDLQGEDWLGEEGCVPKLSWDLDVDDENSGLTVAGLGIGVSGGDGEEFLGEEFFSIGELNHGIMI